MSNTLNVVIKNKGKEWFEATATVPGAGPIKLVKKSDGSSLFSSRAGAKAAARSFLKTVNQLENLDFGDEQPARKAAKRSKKKETSPMEF